MASILVVEDQDELREALHEVLVFAGHEVKTAEHGARALEVLDDEGPVDVILLDLLMPVMDGPTFLDELARRDGMAKIPIIVVSAWADRRPLPPVAGRMTKPVEVRHLLRAIDLVVVPDQPPA